MQERSNLKQQRSKGGFTLVEIMLVIVIIGILAAVAAPKLTGNTKKAMIAKAKAEMKGMKLAIELYEIDNGAFPPSLEALMTSPGTAVNWNGPYMDKIPQDPWGKPYIYSASGNNISLKCAGPLGEGEISL